MLFYLYMALHCNMFVVAAGFLDMVLGLGPALVPVRSVLALLGCWQCAAPTGGCTMRSTGSKSQAQGQAPPPETRKIRTGSTDTGLHRNSPWKIQLQSRTNHRKNANLHAARQRAEAEGKSRGKAVELATSSEAVLRSASDHYDYAYVCSVGRWGPGNWQGKLHVAGSQSRANVTKMPRFSFGQLLRANEEEQQWQQQHQ